MFSYLKKKKEAILFLATIVFSLFFIQAYKESRATETLFGKFVFFFAIPSQELSSFFKNSTISFVNRYVILKDLTAENLTLKRELEKQKLANIQTEKIRIANIGFRKAFLFAQQSKDQIMLAEVVGDIVDSYAKVLVINRGSNDGVLKNQAVLYSSGVVGKILSVDTKVSYVQLITDIKSHIPVVLQRTRDKGMLYGQGKNNLSLRFLPLHSGIKEGDIIATSGIAGIFPKDFPVGRVKTFEENNFFYSVEAVIEPVVNFSRIELVFIMLKSNFNDLLPLFQEQ